MCGTRWQIENGIREVALSTAQVDFGASSRLRLNTRRRRCLRAPETAATVRVAVRHPTRARALLGAWSRRRRRRGDEEQRCHTTDEADPNTSKVLGYSRRYVAAARTRLLAPPTRSRRRELKCSNESYECGVQRCLFVCPTTGTLRSLPARCSISRVLHEMSETLSVSLF